MRILATATTGCMAMASGSLKLVNTYIHPNIINWKLCSLFEQDRQDMELVINSAISAQIADSNNPTGSHGCRMIKVNENKITNRYCKLDGKTTKGNIKNPKLY